MLDVGLPDARRLLEKPSRLLGCLLAGVVHGRNWKGNPLNPITTDSKSIDFSYMFLGIFDISMAKIFFN